MATRIRTRCLVEHRPWRATRKNWRWDSVPIARAEHVASNGKTTYAWIRSDSHRTNGEMRSDRRVGFGAGRNARQRIAPNGKTTRAAPDGASATEGGGESVHNAPLIGGPTKSYSVHTLHKLIARVYDPYRVV